MEAQLMFCVFDIDCRVSSMTLASSCRQLTLAGPGGGGGEEYALDT